MIAAARRSASSTPASIAGVNGYSWQQIAAALRGQQASVSTARDLEFIESVAEQLEYSGPVPTPPQAKWLRDLFMRKIQREDR